MSDSPAVDLALARAVLYGALAEALSADASRLATPDAGPTLARAADCVDAALPGHAPLAPTVALLATHAAAGGQAEAHNRLFGHTARGLVCPFETEYGPDVTFQQPQQLADVAGYYRAFGVAPRGVDRRVDHAACECTFLGFLCQKEAYLLARLEGAPDDRDALETLDATRAAERSFLRDHLARFGRAFASQLADASPSGVYGAVAALLARLIAVDCERAGIDPGPLQLALRSADEDAVPMACGDGSGLIQISRPGLAPP